jgi:hypothetical protein
MAECYLLFLQEQIKDIISSLTAGVGAGGVAHIQFHSFAAVGRLRPACCRWLEK